MSYEQKPNRGVAYANSFKTSQSHPDFRGQFFADRSLLKRLIDNTEGDLIEIAISIWDGVSAKGNQYLGIQVSEPFKKKEPPKAAPETEEDVPF